MSSRNPWIKFKGIIGNIFHFDSGDGPALKNNAGVIEARNAADDAYNIVRGADPVGDDDLVTKRYHDASPPAGSVQCIEIPFDFNDAGTDVDSTQAAVVGGRVVDVKVEILTAFDAATTIDVGDTASDVKFVDDTGGGEIKETKVGLSEFPQYTDTIASIFRVAVGASAATVGSGRALIFYTVPVA